MNNIEASADDFFEIRMADANAKLDSVFSDMVPEQKYFHDVGVLARLEFLHQFHYDPVGFSSADIENTNVGRCKHLISGGKQTAATLALIKPHSDTYSRLLTQISAIDRIENPEGFKELDDKLFDTVKALEGIRQKEIFADIADNAVYAGLDYSALKEKSDSVLSSMKDAVRKSVKDLLDNGFEVGIISARFNVYYWDNSADELVGKKGVGVNPDESGRTIERFSLPRVMFNVVSPEKTAERVCICDHEHVADRANAVAVRPNANDSGFDYGFLNDLIVKRGQALDSLGKSAVMNRSKIQSGIDINNELGL